MNIFEAIILGIVQGITEWLPISSKSHLIIFQKLFGLEQPVIFDLMLHVGSFFVILFVFWKDIKQILYGLMKKDKKSWMMASFIIIATIPIVIAGFVLENVVKQSFNDLKVLGFGFLLSALVIYLSKYPEKKQKNLNLWNSFVIGAGQVLALFPGVSRSGITISTGMILGIKKQDVAKFSFLMFLPAILGATILEIKDIGLVSNMPAAIVGTFVAMITGYFSLKLLLSIIEKNKFSYFSLYCLVLGAIVLLFAYNIV